MESKTKKRPEKFRKLFASSEKLTPARYSPGSPNAGS